MLHLFSLLQLLAPTMAAQSPSHRANPPRTLGSDRPTPTGLDRSMDADRFVLIGSPSGQDHAHIPLGGQRPIPPDADLLKLIWKEGCLDNAVL